MEALFIYGLKSAGLLACFYGVYYFLLRKETFFSSNRWFLLSGLFVSAFLPLMTWTKTVYIERPQWSAEDWMAMAKSNVPSAPSPEPILDWTSLIMGGYAIIALVIIGRILVQLISILVFLKKHPVISEASIRLVNVQQEVTPFSFFNYVVINNQLYSEEERNSIVLHEKIHCRQYHSVDILLSHLYCGLFWFHPLAWRYKKAIAQNLEFLADQKAMEQLQSPTVYQKTLVKVATGKQALALTNPFNQSLIKKRILMLQQTQSQRRNLWKYGIMLPALVGFMLIFQVKTVAQERKSVYEIKSEIQETFQIRWDKNATEAEMKKDIAFAKAQGIILKYSKLKRNDWGEITQIKVQYSAGDSKGETTIMSDSGIKPLVFVKSNSYIGFAAPKSETIIASKVDKEDIQGKEIRIEERIIRNEDGTEIIINDTDNASQPKNGERIVIRKFDASDKPLVFINGKMMDVDFDLNSLDPNTIASMSVFKNSPEALEMGKNGVIKIITKKVVTSDNIKDEEEINAAVNRAKEEIKKVLSEDKSTQADWEKARQDLAKVQEEMLKMKAEMEKAKAEYEKAKSKLKKD
ncbi:M56 family metallopeptidase [Flavobacterium sp.]|jgi:hypothetical protein|uniref:M56 family metallopeptidase n=1 Tax=Flavobacterium sp. TaxID=239 RepID=UPI0022C1565A|nr:M56 family metallopeptidase [Flavobacterium sp.]MCZ8145592.1 TonB-dependent receptor plug domain-containing protein [Flavobacterium sp.]MCZ8366527.1 TonB-dependent receptor plug domain-containing protein [Flavobacterium sp.]